MHAMTVASGKGGVGKTTVTINLGIALARKGYSVVLIDADIEMGNLTIYLGMQENLTPTFQDVLAGDARMKDAMFDGPGGVKVVPAGISLEGLRRAEPSRMIEAVKELEGLVDIALLDAPAGLGLSARPALASGHVLPVVNPDVTSISNAIKTKMVANESGSSIIGIALNRVTLDFAEPGQEEIARAMETRVLAAIPDDPEVRRSILDGKPLVLYNPKAPASLALLKLAENTKIYFDSLELL